MTSSRFCDDTERFAFCERLEKLWLDKTLCDVKIKCQYYETTAHRHVLAAQSDWFLKAFTSGFVETEAKEIVLQEDEPAVVEVMLRFCYTLEYGDMDRVMASAPTGTCGPMAFNVHVFVAAEKYLIEPLQRFALNRIRYHAINNFNADDFAKAVEHAYTATLDSKKVLRRAIIKISFDKAGELFARDSPYTSAVFDAMADRVPSYTADMMRAAQRTGRLGEERQQLSCPTDFCYNPLYCEVDADGFVSTQCNKCEQSHYGSAEEFGLFAYPEGFNAAS